MTYDSERLTRLRAYLETLYHDRDNSPHPMDKEFLRLEIKRVQLQELQMINDLRARGL